MLKWKYFIVLSILLIVSQNRIIFVSSQENDPSLNINSDKEVYSPGSVALLVISGNSNASGSLDIKFENYTLHHYKFENLSLSPAQFLWNIEPHATNGTYTAFAYYNADHNINKTLILYIQRLELIIPKESYRFLELNVTFYYKRTTLKDWELNVTNLFTHESEYYRDIRNNFLITLDDNTDNMIKYKPGQAIYLKLSTYDNRFVKEIVIAAEAGMNIIQTEADKHYSENAGVKFGFIALGLVIAIYIIIYVKNNLKQRKIQQRNIINPHDMPEIDYNF